jgi:hypothetical protein
MSPATHSSMLFTTTQSLPLKNFKPPFLGNHTSFLEFFFRIKFLEPESINDEEISFAVCVVLQLHTPTCISLLLNTYPSKTSNHHFLETIQVSWNFLSELNSLNLFSISLNATCFMSVIRCVLFCLLEIIFSVYNCVWHSVFQLFTIKTLFLCWY